MLYTEYILSFAKSWQKANKSKHIFINLACLVSFFGTSSEEM